MLDVKFWIGKVEDINDPEKAGKVQVQIFNYFELPPAGKTQKEDLPWCIPLLPTTSPSIDGIGDTPQFVVGSRVMGFFVDGGNHGLVSKPYIMGTMPIAPDDDNKNSISFLARGKDTVEEKKVSPVVQNSSYKAEYPLNRVIQSRKGHIIELDDTDGGERIRIRHGTNKAYVEIAPSGAVTISTEDNVIVAAGGTADIHAKKDALIKADGTIKITGDQGIELVSAGDISMASAGRISFFGLGGVSTASGADITVEGPGGLGITQGSLYVSGSCSIGTGFNGPLIAGGKNLMFKNGIAYAGS